MVYFPSSRKQCFCTTLQNRQTQKFHLIAQCHAIILLKTSKHIVHRLSINSFIPLSKHPTADVRSVRRLREHPPTDAFSTR